jgi:hypothetical protein
MAELAEDFAGDAAVSGDLEEVSEDLVAGMCK